jgi:hypothetical protein
MSLTPREARILELWDTGLSISQISERLSCRKKVVENTVSYFSGRSDQRLAEKSIREGSQKLAAALSEARQ